ncbi:hypothetical protein MKW92_032285, partial [Papaver armeniacum]
MQSRPAIFIFVFIYGFFLSENLVSAVCSDREIEALLNFKLDLVDSSYFLSNWVGKDCCKWNGVIVGKPPRFRVENLQWLSNLSSLQYLDMSYNVFVNASSNWLHTVNMIPSLLELRLHYCDLYLNFPSISYSNLTSLKVLDLGYSGVNSTLPEWIYSLTSLEKLDNGHNNFRGTISEAIGNLDNLTDLDISTNSLDLSVNYFKGEIYFLANPSSCIGSSLMSINLEENQFSCPLPDQLGSFKNLEYLSFMGNSFSGPIPSSLKVLNVFFNKLNGSIPESLGRLSRLRILRFAFNALEGIISEAHFANLRSLEELEVHSLVFKLKPDWIPPFQLQVANLQACKLGPQFPKWLETQKNISRIDISNAGISDTVVPIWFWNMSTQFSFLKGILIKYTYFAMQSLSKMNTRILDLSGNQLSGEIPDCWSGWPYLVSVSLAGNYLTGEIAASIGSINTLRSLHLRNNSLSGELPSALLKCTELRVIDFSENEFTGNIPKWIGEYLFLLILRLRFNKFYGVIPQ